MIRLRTSTCAPGCRPMLVAWSMDGLGVSLLVTMFPFFVRYIVVPDGSKAQESGYAMDPQVPPPCMAHVLLNMAQVLHTSAHAGAKDGCKQSLPSHLSIS